MNKGDKIKLKESIFSHIYGDLSTIKDEMLYLIGFHDRKPMAYVATDENIDIEEAIVVFVGDIEKV